MSDDFKFLPTRTGNAQGHATERTMLDGVGGADNIRKSYRTMPDGSKVMLHTQNGRAHFSTTEPERKSEEDCLRGPFEEFVESDVDYKSRAYYEAAEVQTWGGFASVAVRALKYLVVENALKRKIAFVFRWAEEPAPGDIPASSAEFRESDYAGREYYPENTDTMIPQSLRSGVVFGRFKAVNAPIKTIPCDGEKLLSFAEPGTDGTNATAQGCVRKALSEYFEATREFAGGWLQRIFLATGTGVADVTVLDEQGFLSPLDTGDDLACMDIPAIGTRVLGVRLDDMVYLNNGTQRAMRDYEQGDSPTLVYLQSRTLEEPDRFGNVAGLLWRPSYAPTSRGPDVAVYSGNYPFISSFLRLNEDDSVWFVERVNGQSGYLTFAATPLGGGDGQVIAVELAWPTQYDTFLSSHNLTVWMVITDVSKHGDKIIYSWLDISDAGIAMPRGPVFAAEVVFEGDFPNATASARWIITGANCIPPGSPLQLSDVFAEVIGAFFDPETDKAMLSLYDRKHEGTVFPHSAGIGGLSGGYTYTIQHGFGTCEVGSTTLPPMVYRRGRTFTRVETGPCVHYEVDQNGNPTSPFDILRTITITNTDADGATLSTGANTPEVVQYPEEQRPGYSYTERFFSGHPWFSSLYMGHKCCQVYDINSYNARLALSAGKPASPVLGINCEITKHWTVVGDDSITPMALRNPVNGEVTFVGVETNGFLNTLFRRFNFI